MLLWQSLADGGVLGGNESLHAYDYALVAKDGPYDMLLPGETCEIEATVYVGAHCSAALNGGFATLEARGYAFLGLFDCAVCALCSSDARSLASSLDAGSSCCFRERYFGTSASLLPVPATASSPRSCLSATRQSSSRRAAPRTSLGDFPYLVH
mgnify:CR=1 FL=1